MSIPPDPRRGRSLDRTVVSRSETTRKRRSNTVIHVSIFGKMQPYVTRDNKVLPSNRGFYNANYPKSMQLEYQSSIVRNQKSFQTNPWLNRSNAPHRDHGQILPEEKRKERKRRRLPIFGRLCLFYCIFCCLLTAILIGSLVAILVLLSQSSSTTTASSAVQAATADLTTPGALISTTATTETTATTTSSTASTTSSVTTASTSTTSVSTVCSTTAITTTITATSLPPQCSNYTSNTDGTRNAGYTTLGGACDNTVFTSTPMWVRFSGAAGTLLANCPVFSTNCNTNAAGWYSGVYPSTAGDTTNGTVCYNRPGNTCIYNNSISVTNCNGYYVFALTSSPRCSLRYCTI